MQKRCAIYARFSSDMQRDASIDDQLRVVREYIARQPGWSEAEVFTDYAISGSTEARPGFQDLLHAAKSPDGPFDIVIAESQDRFARNLATSATLLQDLSFLGIELHTVYQGHINLMKVAFDGTRAQEELVEIGRKTKRGQRGRLEQGRVPGGKAYGYDIANTIDHRGQVERGIRTINQEQAAIVQRIFKEYAAGSSPRSIAHGLNSDGVISPSGGKWRDTAINGNKARQTGILYNPIYKGLLVWNRQSWKKHPKTGKRVSKPNPESEWKSKEVPELRIIDQQLWEDVQGRKSVYAAMSAPKARRAHRVLSGVIKCGVCGGVMVIINRDRYGCGTRRTEGNHACTNTNSIPRAEIEDRVFKGLKYQLEAPHLVKLFVKEYTAAVNAAVSQKDGRQQKLERRIAELDQKLGRIMDAIANGTDFPEMHSQARQLSAEKQDTQQELSGLDHTLTAIHPNADHVYRKRINELYDNLTNITDDSHAQAAELIRDMVEGIYVRPGELRGQNIIELSGDLAGILSVAIGDGKNNAGTKIVAAEGFTEYRAGIRAITV